MIDAETRLKPSTRSKEELFACRACCCRHAIGTGDARSAERAGDVLRLVEALRMYPPADGKLRHRLKNYATSRRSRSIA